MHTPEIKTVLSEAMRVLRPGGIVSAREMDVPGSYISPANPSQKNTFWTMLSQVIRRNGGDPLMGRHLKTFLNNAGFEHVTADFFDSPEDLEFLCDFLANWALSPQMERQALDLNLATCTDFLGWRTQLQRWSSHPGAVGCFQFGHALGRKPAR